MQRRTYIKTMLAGAAAASAAQAAEPKPIQLHADLTVDPSKEKQFLHDFHTTFFPAAAKFQGFIDLKLIKLRTALMGKGPAGVNYRFVLTYQSEELRQKWANSPIHLKVWPMLENQLATKDYTVLLFDVA